MAASKIYNDGSFPKAPNSFQKLEEKSYYVGTELISEAWEACRNAYNSRNFCTVEYKNVMIIAFSGFQSSTDFITDCDFDECSLCDSGEFECMKDGDSGYPNPPLVRKAFVDRFLYILRSSNLKTKVLEIDKVQKVENEKKTIIFTGHSFGGAIASLCTLWTLGKYPKLRAQCITFGSPLVGDKIFAKSIEREKWSPYFCHIVSRHDIVPRICFSPFKSTAISKALEELIPYWYDSIKNQMKPTSQKTGQVQDGSHPLSKESSQDFIKRVISDASQVVTHETTTLVVGPANLVGGGMRDLIKRSPYRPFGYYVFCSSSGTVCSIDNPQTTLHMLYFSLENKKLFGACIMEHIEYDKTIKHIANNLGLTSSYSKTMKSEKSMAADVRIDLQLEAMGICNENTQAWLGLKTIEENKNKLATNMEQQVTKLEEMQEFMAKLEWYKTMCEQNEKGSQLALGYYDCFKAHKTKNDLKANKNRVKLAAFWDRITELVEKEDLPNEVPSEEKWVNAGSEYRLLVEPLEIAHYYGLGKHEEYGPYVTNGRPRRYKLLQQWLENKNRKCGRQPRPRTQPAILTQDSCFWAYVEDLICSLKLPTSTTDKESISFQKTVENMMDRHEISLDVFSSNGTFALWWNSYKVQNTGQDLQSFYDKLTNYAPHAQLSP